jgi:hypothetical protein
MKVITKDIDKHDYLMNDAINYRGQKIWLGLREKDMFLSVWINDEWVSGINVSETKNMVTLKPGADHLTLNLKKRQIYLHHAHNLITIAKGIVDAKH